MQERQQPWYRERHQRVWVAAAVGALGLGCVLIQQWHRGLALKADYEATSTAVDADKSLNARLSNDVAGYQELVDRGSSQKEQLIQEIAEFEKQLDLLKNRTKGLELVKGGLGKTGCRLWPVPQDRGAVQGQPPAPGR
jgi:hypothetical protein